MQARTHLTILPSQSNKGCPKCLRLQARRSKMDPGRWALPQPQPLSVEPHKTRGGALHSTFDLHHDGEDGEDGEEEFHIVIE
jgi:hypothetical protein